MKASEIRAALIPKLSAFCGFPIIQGDGNGPLPDGVHATYKITTPNGKDNGGPVEIYSNGEFTFQESKKVTISFTAYDADDDVSFDAAEKIHDWFKFYGEVDLNAANIAIVELSNITNRDAFVVENYERRNGFDVIIRVIREFTRVATYIERAEITGNTTN
jgi:hypothetical protein